ncbi:tetratricopeptide repeat protein [Endozoicomonas sp. SCSIO W0465]|uniref:tetratricopeptide repeat protein n=1 Tax=Endozoicomonas sp. SCSIO W0465 TaxID=2918516 RepID=UPI0020763D2C|nr:tetratricopeptide repeat protein [Endozoicomonas sp. SCSIO W0465]USE35147.1 tetratricopeptide repeat protein [Endozoicomonas sp. SCSIO W0465]
MIRMIARAEYFITEAEVFRRCSKALVLFFVVFLVGCSSQTVRQVGSVATTLSDSQSQLQADDPVTPFEAETLYDLLVAEVSGQRQRYDLALGNYLKQAHKTRDIGVAQRAYQVAVYVGARQAALDASLLWVELQPDNPDALNGAALELVYAGQYERAFAQMSQQLSLGGSPAFDILASAVGNDQGKHSEGGRLDLVRQFEALSQAYPNERVLKLGQAILLQQVGEFESALALANELLKQDRGFVSAIMVKGRALHKLKRDAEAEVMLFEAVQRYPDKNRLRLLYGRVLVHAGKLDQARKQFEVLLERAPGESDVVLSLGLITLENGLEQEAGQYFEQLLTLGERDNTAHYYLGRLSEKQQKYASAKEHYLSVGPGKEFMAAQVALTGMLVEQDKLKEALTYLGEARNRHPARMESLFLLEGELLVNDGQLDKALTLFERALKTNPESVNLLYSRAMVYEKLNNLEGMEQDLRSILEFEPDNAAALNALGYTLADRTDRFKEAEALILQAYELDSEDPAILDSMGWVQFRLGNFDQAEKYLRMAYRQFPDAEIAAHLGEVLWARGEQDAARLLWAEALQKSPDSQILKDTMDRLTGAEPESQAETVSSAP